MAIIYSYPEVTSLQATDRFIISRFNSNGDIFNYSLELDTLSSYNPNNYTSNLGVVQSLTTNNSSGAATLTNGVLNIPQYSGGGGVTGSGVAGRVAFWNGTSEVSSDSNFLWDSANNRLGIGTSTPSHAIDVTGTNYYYASNGIPFAYKAVGAGEDIRIGDVDGEDVALSLYDNNTAPVVRVIDGKVGIGVTAPSEKLDVAGNIELSQFGYVYFGKNTSDQLTISNSISGSQIRQAGSGYLDLKSITNGIRLQVGSGLSDEKVVVSSTGQVQFNDYTSSTSFTGTAVATLGVDSSGNIITSSPGGGGETYDLNAGTKSGNSVPLNLTSGSGSDNSLVTLTEGTGVTLTRNSATQITIASSGGGGGATDINGLSDGSTSSNNIALGSTNLNGSFNTITGQLAAQGTYTQGITAFGYRAARYLSTGSQYNVAIGGQALDGLGAIVQNAQYNVAVGNLALSGVISGASYNTAIGANANSSSNVSGTNMVSIGYNSNPKFKTGSYNICIGTQSGESISPEPVSWSASSHNVFIGARVSGAYTIGNAAIDGLIRIGSYGYSNTAIEMLSHQCVIGNDGTGTGVNDTTTIRPVKNNITDLGTSTAKYKDVYYDGVLQSGTLNSAPSSATDTGTTGEVRFTADYIYVCVATNTWKRTSITTW